MSKSIIDWGLRDINEMLGVNRFLNIDPDTDDYLEDFLEEIEKINLEEMIITIAKDYRVKNWRHPVSSALVVMDAVFEAARIHNNHTFEEKVFLDKDQLKLLHKMGDCYSTGGYSLCMEPEPSKGLQIVLSFPSIYANFVRTIMASENKIFNHHRAIESR